MKGSAEVATNVRRILVAYSMAHNHVRTIYDYLTAFSLLDGDVEYLHVTHEANIKVDLGRYDVVINSYCARHCFEQYVTPHFVELLSRYQGVKVLVVQDEYNNTNLLKQAIQKIGFDVILTCVPQESLGYVYPRQEFGNITFETALTGYVPDYFARPSIQPVPLSERRIVVGYRGRNLPSYYGQLAFEKYEIGRRMRELCQLRSIPHDIEMEEERRI